MRPPRILAFGGAEGLLENLRANGYEVMPAAGRVRALGLARDLLPELILVEAASSIETSVQLVRELSIDPTTRLLPLVLVVPERAAEWVRQGLEAGANDVVSAGMEQGEVLARVAAALRSKRALEDLLVEKQRATLLELAGAVAHKINQPLTAMSVIVETLIASHARADLSPERLKAKLEDLQRLVDRMAVIVKQVSNVVEYRTVHYVGDVRIIDLEPGAGPKR